MNHSAWKSTKLALKIGEFFHFPMGWEFIKEKKENTQERKHACVHENTQTRTRTRKRPRKKEIAQEEMSGQESNQKINKKINNVQNET